MSNLSTNVKVVKMHSDQMSQRTHDSWVALCVLMTGDLSSVPKSKGAHSLIARIANAVHLIELEGHYDSLWMLFSIVRNIKNIFVLVNAIYTSLQSWKLRQPTTEVQWTIQSSSGWAIDPTFVVVVPLFLPYVVRPLR